MKEIKINLSNLGTAIGRLNSLKQSWSNDVTLPPVSVGGGETVAELEALAKLYQDLHSHMITLASNTATFLTNVGGSFESSDQKAASGFSGIQGSMMGGR